MSCEEVLLPWNAEGFKAAGSAVSVKKSLLASALKWS